MLSLPACTEASAGLLFTLVRRSLGEGGSKHENSDRIPLWRIQIRRSAAR